MDPLFFVFWVDSGCRFKPQDTEPRVHGLQLCAQLKPSYFAAAAPASNAAAAAGRVLWAAPVAAASVLSMDLLK